MVTWLSAGRCIQPEAPCGSARCRGHGAACRWLVPSLGARSRVCVDGSSRHPGPEPYRPQRPVPLLQARSCVDRLGSSRATWARSRLDRTGSSRPPGPEQIGDRPLLRWALGLRVFGPYFALGRDLATFALGEVPMTGRPLLCAGPPRLDGSSFPRGHDLTPGTVLHRPRRTSSPPALAAVRRP